MAEPPADPASTEPRRPTLLAIGDAIAPTGFARVLHAILEPLTQSWDVHQLGVNFFGDPHDKPWKIYPANVKAGPMGVERIKEMVERLSPDVVFAVRELWVQGPYVAQLRTLEPRPKIVLYTSVDGDPVDPRHLEAVEGVDRFVTYTEYGRRVLGEALAVVRKKRPDFAFPEIEVLPHGVDTDAFRPWGGDPNRPLADEERQTKIRALYKDRPDFEDAFIVLNGNRNQPRKRIDLTIHGFALFARDKPPNVKLHLHMASVDLGWDVVRLAERHGIRDRLILSSPAPGLPDLTPEKLNDIYNTARVGINTSTGEGWGLVSFEHAATGAAQIVPGHTACAELWEGSALMVKPVLRVTNAGGLFDAHFVSPEGVADALQRLYGDPRLLREMSRKAFEHARRPCFRWEKLACKWDILLRETLQNSSAAKAGNS